MPITLMQFTSLDGVSQGPGAPDEDTTGGFARGGWLVPFVDDAFLALVTSWVAEADGFLLGRRTYEEFAAAWPLVTDPADTVAVALNGLPKYVAATAGTPAPWGPAEIVSGDLEVRVAELRAGPGRELQVHGSTTLARSLLAAGLVDELRLVVAPVIVGQGRRLFPPTGRPPASPR